MLMIFDNSIEWYGCAIMIVSVLISLMFYNCVRHSSMRCWIASAFINVIVVGVMEMARDINMANYSEKDGRGCPFI